MVVAELKQLSYRFPDSPRAALDGVDLTLRAGELVLLAGASGSGKSTLLRALCGLVPHFHGGRFGGSCIVNGLDTRRSQPAAVCAQAGLVFQDPESATVMLRVEREVAFGLENAGVAAGEIGSLVASALAAAGATPLLERSVRELSGGELQRVALASALVTRPRLCLLDEPTSQLDPAAADALARHLRWLCDDLGLAVVVAEHRTERLAAVADRIVALERGRIVADGAPDQVELPPSAPPSVSTPRAGGAVAARLLGVTAGYGERSVLRGLDLELRSGTVTALAGLNGAGKTTLARVLAGLHDLDGGSVHVGGVDVTALPAEQRFPRVGYVGQDPGRYLLHERVDDEVGFALRLAGVPLAERRARVAATLASLGLAQHAARHPRDLSGGERERVALASVIVAEPGVLVLDEPTRGMDVAARSTLAALLRRHAERGGTALVVTHDEGVAAAVADRRCALVDGGVRELNGVVLEPVA